ncbi:tRNA (32-2'-O)-methyltransferase regulator THADA-like isoform X2 [Panulirus ornatus]|uniref:tRNA (32-2'-O)-methyltransferase regulator THADA-like isoform X2 n=1 Tax=Panulirus ornatus TaxID=150431 RepID=UPI003A8A42EF
MILLKLSILALYNILQYSGPQVFLHLENSQVTKLLEKVYFSLLVALKSDRLPSDSALIISTSLCITLSYLKQEHRKAEFVHVLSTLNEIQLSEIQNYIKCSSEQISEYQHDQMKYWRNNTDVLTGKFEHIKPSYPVVLLLHGLFNSGLQWIYYDGGWSDFEIDNRTVSREKHSKEHDIDRNTSFKQSDGLPLTQVQKNKGIDDREDENIFLYDVYPLIEKLCKGATSYTFQAFQVLHMWLSCVRKLGKKMQENFADVQEQKTSGLCQDFLESNHPTTQLVFTIQSTRHDTVFHLLNSNWENPAKGASDVVYTCMVELLELHEDGQPGSAKMLAKNMLATLLSSAAWGSKSTYPPLALAVSYVGAEEALDLHPTLPSGLMTSLSVNHLAPAGVSVYKIILGQLSSSLWFQHFFTVICEALHSDNRLIRQHVLSLWLPPTLRQYPSMYLELLGGCQDTSSGWVALMAVLRVARSIGTFNLEEYCGMHSQKMSCISETQGFFSESTMITDIEERKEMKDTDISSTSLNDFNENTNKTVTRIPIFSFIRLALCHVDETVRGEALSLLCHTQKASQPVLLESNFLKFFFKWNMNIDSAPFRQGIIKCYKALVVRLRDASASELKNSPFRALSSGQCSTEFLKNFSVTPTLKINIELLVWLVELFHSNLAPDGNYQRRVLSLQLYKETLLAFYEKKSDLTYSMNQRFMTVCAYMNYISCNSVSPDDSKRDSQPIRDLTLPWTLEMLLSSCLDEMNDIREEAEWTLKILESSKSSLAFSEAEKWLRRGLILCNSPKASDAESGATLVKVVSSLCYCSDYGFSSVLKNIGKGCESQDLLHFLLGCVEAQFKAAQKNLLEAARCTPIHGSLMALSRCLSEDRGVASMSSEEIQEFIQKLTVMMVEMIEFMLSKLACASPNGSAIPPSFAEMGEAVEVIIQECGGSMEASSKATPDIFSYAAVEEEDGAPYDDTAISADYLLVLACCWQTMKTCCIVSNICVSCWLNCLHANQIEKLLSAVVVRVLTSTRHKGAMEAAKTAYSQLCFVLLTTNSDTGQLIYKQVEDVLDQLKAGVQTSVTRRAAGMAMMLQVACGAAPRVNSMLINNTITKLMNIAQTEYEDQSIMDSPPVLALHVLHSLVIHAPLAHHLIHHMPAITATCLHAFTNKSWALRNAALQLYGAVVPRMVGQKKVQDDSSTLNSLTAPEFLSRHPVLADFLLKLLSGSQDERKVHEILTCNVGRRERGGRTEKHIPINTSSSLVPVLSLVARLSPGTGLQQSNELKVILHNFCQVTTTLIGSPVHTVRRLASLAVVALTLTEQAPQCINNLLHLMREPKLMTTNLIHGNLLTLMNFVQTYSQVRDDVELRKNIFTSLVRFLGHDVKCYINATLALKILMLLQLDDITINMLPIDLSQPGAAEYKQMVTKIKIKHNFQDEIEKVLMSEVPDNHDLDDLCIDRILDNVRMYKNISWLSKIERLIWKRLEQEPLTYKSASVNMKLLCTLLEKNDILGSSPSEKCVRNLLIVLKGCHGVRLTSLALVIVAHLFQKLHENHWPGREIKSHLLSTFTDVISLYSTPTSTEDYRLTASIALKISIKALLCSEQDISLSCKEKIIFACTELLQDEDSCIRNSACYIVLSFASTDQHLRAVSENNIKIIHFEKFMLHSLSGSALHPNLALLEFAKVIARRCISTSDWSTFRVLWKICSSQYCFDFSASHEISSNSRSYLFQSHTMNLYKEPKQLSLILAKALLEMLQQGTRTINKSESPRWLQEEGEVLNKQGEIFTRLLSQQQNLSTQKQLLSAVSTYIVACETLLSMSNIFNISVSLSFPLLWNSSSFCAVDMVTEC